MLSFLAPELIWFFLGLILLLGELAFPAFVVVFFGIGAWVTSLAVVFGIAPNIDMQLVIFVAISLATLILFRKSGKKMASGRVSGKVHDLANTDSSHGTLGVAIEDFDIQSKIGKVEYNGTAWRAISEAPIKKGDSVEITGRDNLTLKVKPLN